MESKFVMNLSANSEAVDRTICRHELGIFLFSETYRECMGANKTPIQWVQKTLSPVVIQLDLTVVTFV